MAKYDNSLDKTIVAQTKDFGNTRITVGVHSYNEGEKKIQIVRENKTANEEWRFAKLGRLSKDEIEGILPVIQESIQKL